MASVAAGSAARPASRLIILLRTILAFGAWVTGCGVTDSNPGPLPQPISVSVSPFLGPRQPFTATVTNTTKHQRELELVRVGLLRRSLRHVVKKSAS